MNRLLFSTFFAATTFASLAATSHAVTIFSEDFDPLTAGTQVQVGFTFGETVSSSSGIGAGAGLTGDSWQTVNTTTPSVGFSGVGAQYQNFGITGNTSSDLSDYTLSFDAKADGGNLNIQLETFAEAGFGGGVTGKLGTAPLPNDFGNDQTLNSTYTHYELNLGDTNVFMQNSGIDMTGGSIQVAFQFNGTGSAPFTQTLDVDNLTLTMVPEPSTLLLFGTGLIAIAGLRKKNG